LREMIAEKSFHYSVIRAAPNKGVRTRARSVIGKLNQRIALCCRLYNRCRSRILQLGVDEATLQKFQILGKQDIKASTAILDPNIPGTSAIRLSWIWHSALSHPSSTPDSPELLRECLSITFFITIFMLN
jgi:hypothetical protein